MKICKKCNEKIKSTKINGIRYGVGNRSNCYNCVPHNAVPKVGGIKECQCEQCGRYYLYTIGKSNSCTKNMCQNCYAKSRIKNNKNKLVKFMGGSCVLCGYDKCNRALHFHHLDPSEKEFTIGDSKYNKIWYKSIEEVKKTILVCGNCHGEIHDGLIDKKELEKYRFKES